MSAKILTLSLYIFFCFNAVASQNATFLIKGQVIDEQNLPIASVNVFVKQKQVFTDTHGHFSISPNLSDTFQLRFNKPGYYDSVQTFSYNELKQGKNSTERLTQITLVKKAKNRVMLAFGGDVMMGRRYYTPHFNATPTISDADILLGSKAVVQHIKPYMSIADYAAVNLETQISSSTPKQRAPKSVTFFSKPELLTALSWAGIDYVSLGNNHTFDYMDEGLTSTLAALEDSSLDYSGAGLNDQQALAAHHQKIKGRKFSMLGYVGWEGRVKPTQTANAEHGGAAFGSMENIKRSVGKVIKQNSTPIVQYHGSLEYADNPTLVTEQRLKSALDAGASLAVAHHPHVTQGLELYNNKLIAYSMGNLIFDQNFPSTKYSYILYVWLDDGVFHRAEIIPLYLKSYQPTPATGIERFKVMKRLIALSKQRDTHIIQSGGHGVINIENTIENSKTLHQQLSFAPNERVVPFSPLFWSKQINSIKFSPQQQSTTINEQAIRYRLGTNLINGSDFESYNYFNNKEQSWLVDEDIMSINNYGASGQHSMGLTLKSMQPSFLGMKYFTRVYAQSNPMTLKAKFKSNSPVKIRFYWQGRTKKQKLLTALNESKKHLIKEIELPANDLIWQNIELDFNSPRYGYKSYRVLAEIELLDASVGKVDIDDFSLIEWQTAYSELSVPPRYNLTSKQAQYIGINQQVNSPLSLQYH